MAATTARTLLNKKPQQQRFQINQLVYIPDFLISKNVHSIMEALGRVVEVHNIRNYSIRMLSGQVLRRNVKHMLSTNANFHTASVENIDAFQIPSIHETLLPGQVESYFDLQPYQFSKSIVNRAVDE